MLTLRYCAPDRLFSKMPESQVGSDSAFSAIFHSGFRLVRVINQVLVPWLMTSQNSQSGTDVSSASRIESQV